jgi:putative spermidine/putrescine transport system permease protein
MSRRATVLGAYNLVLGVLLVLPIAVVVISSFTGSNFTSFPLTSWGVRWYASAFANSEVVGALVTSLSVAALMTCISLVAGTAAALGLRTVQGGLSTAAQTFFLSPLMLPTIVLGVALLQVFQATGIVGSFAVIAVGQAIIGIPYVVRLTLASLAGVDNDVERAARSLGASSLQVLVRVTLPLIRQGVIAGALFSFIMSLDDVNIALFLSGVHTTPLSVWIFSYIEQNSDPLASAVSSILVILAAIAIFICDRLVGLDWLFGLRAR